MKLSTKAAMTAGALMIPAVALVGAVAAAPLGEEIDLTEEQIAVIESADEEYKSTLEEAGLTVQDARHYRQLTRRNERFEEHKDEMAEFLGVTVEELESAHENGTVKELIEESGKTQDEIFAFHEELREAHIQSLLESGEITEEQAEQMLERGPREGRGRGMGRGMGRGPGMMNQAE